MARIDLGPAREDMPEQTMPRHRQKPGRASTNLVYTVRRLLSVGQDPCACSSFVAGSPSSGRSLVRVRVTKLDPRGCSPDETDWSPPNAGLLLFLRDVRLRTIPLTDVL